MKSDFFPSTRTPLISGPLHNRVLAVFIGFIAAIAVGDAHAFNWPWSDASKYRSECKQACVEDSFGKGTAGEIAYRCNNKCDGLPTSPTEQWANYDRCLVVQEEFERRSRNYPSGCLYPRRQQCPPMSTDDSLFFIGHPLAAMAGEYECTAPSVPKPK